MRTTRQLLAALLVVAMILPGLGPAWTAEAQSPTPPPPPGAAPAPANQAQDVTPMRISYLNGEVSFWRPGATEWAPARLNTPLAPGDILYTGEAGTVELQLAPRAFVRAAPGTHLGLDNQEPDFVQLRVTEGHAALDVREMPAGDTVEIATPAGAFTVEKTGYYPVDVTAEATTFRAHRGGAATVTPAGGNATAIATNQQVNLAGTETPRVEIATAPSLSEWDRWNYQRTDYMTQPASTQYVGSGVYGAEELDRHGTWRTVETYGSVWVPTAVAPGWVPYSTGRWIWDPRFGWTWLDDAAWGWAPYHHGRWVFVHNYWAWAPGPIVVRPVYSPALVVFLGGVTVSVGRPVFWAPLYWGEPVIPWWGRPGFVGVASWRGWGGPRVVNNVVINRNTTVNVTNINVYRNVNVTNAVVGVPADRFGRGQAPVQRVSNVQVRELQPVRGAVDVKPVAASVVPGTGPAKRPPAALESRPVVATRPPRDITPALQSQGLPTASPAATPAPAPRIVPSPRQSGRRDPAVETGGKQNGPAASPRVVTPPRGGAAPQPGVATPPASPRGAAPQPGVAPPPAQPRVVNPDVTPRSEGTPRPDSPKRERRQGGDAERGVTTSPPPTPGGAPAPPTPPGSKTTNGPPAATPAPKAPAPAVSVPPAPRVINPPPAPPAARTPAPDTSAPGAPAAPSAPGRDQARPEPRGSAPPRQPAPPAPSIQQAPPQPSGGQPPATPRNEQRPDRSDRPGRVETPRARIEAPSPPPRPERIPERVQERAAPPEPRIERVAPERGGPERGGSERGGSDRGNRERERGKPAA
jgi:Family of unknown function (DUF6600)